MKTINIKFEELAKPTFLHRIILYILIFLGYLLAYFFLIYLIQYFVIYNLNGKIYNTDRLLGHTKEDDKILQRQINLQNIKPTDMKKIRQVSYWGNWAIDLHTPGSLEADTRYWFQPLLSFSSIAFLMGLLFATVITTFIPTRYGYFRQKIEREIITFLSQIHSVLYGTQSFKYDEQIANQIIKANSNELRELSQTWQIPVDDLIVLQNALVWKNSSMIYKILHPFAGLRLYLRNHFTEKYSNTILGFVYIGAAFLIIIIGLRGLKFIPASEPSLVFFALGLEFSILITYAFTLMFARPDEQTEPIKTSSTDKTTIASRQMENLLRSFLKWKKSE